LYTRHKHIEEFIVFTILSIASPDTRTAARVDENQVETTNLPLVTGIMSNVRTEAKCRLYRRHFTKIGEFFYLGPKGSMPLSRR